MTHADVVNMLRSVYNIPENAEVVIEGIGNTLYKKIVDGLANLPETPANKIARIKRLRELFAIPDVNVYSGHPWSTLSLADSKHYIENYAAFLDYINKNNVLPPAGHSFSPR